ncbi:MAG TPA: 3-dehydroquinate synthase [Gemmatimonadaceae bacterium]|nr:3-dehydroquinate synthase [Gemmatimonadaceae bacterium]
MTGHVISLAGYDARVEPGLLDSLGRHVEAAAPAHRYVVVTDYAVAALHGATVRRALAGLAAEWIEIPPGEQEKTRERWAWLTDRLLALGCGRDTTLVALGGGVIGDLVGFTAATFMRGVPFVQVPTTLLAMVDASVGGKTAVDVPAGKNLVGAFHPPAAVLADPAVLRTLPAEERRAGLAEVLKHGVIADAGYLARTVSALPVLLDPMLSDAPPVVDAIVRSIEIKAEVVAADEREQGRRKTLNFGHTIGHAVELASEFRLLHGEAVAIGMSLESSLAERLAVAEPGTAEAVDAALRRADLPRDIPPGIDPDIVVAATRSDKKARRGTAEYALPVRVGQMAGAERGWGIAVPEDAVRALLAERTPA